MLSLYWWEVVHHTNAVFLSYVLWRHSVLCGPDHEIAGRCPHAVCGLHARTSCLASGPLSLFGVGLLVAALGSFGALRWRCALLGRFARRLLRWRCACLFTAWLLGVAPLSLALSLRLGCRCARRLLRCRCAVVWLRHEVVGLGRLLALYTRLA